MRDQEFFNRVTALATVIVIGAALISTEAAPPGPGTGSGGLATSFLNLTISVNATTGWPQYVPANFSVPRGMVEVTIVDRDLPMARPGCSCSVAGTTGGVERVNGSAVGTVSDTNVAHTFTIGALGLNVLVPGASSVSFSFEVPRAGTHEWNCLAPCGAGTDPYGAPPMGVPGYMTGTLVGL